MMDEEYERYRVEQAHAYLERIRKSGHDCAGLRQQVDDARERAAGLKGIDYAAIKVASSVDDAMGDAVARIFDSISEYVSALAQYEDERHEATMAMDRMDDATESKVLRLRYLCGWEWERVCVDMHYSWQGMMSLRRRALCSFYDYMPFPEREPLHPAV